MQEPFRKSSFIFWQYPVVWLPVVVADLVSFFIGQVRKPFISALTARFADDTVFASHPSTIHLSQSVIVAIAIAFSAASFFFRLGIYTTALIATSVLVKRRLENQSASALYSIIKQSATRIVAFVLKLAALIGLAAASFIFFVALASKGSVRLFDVTHLPQHYYTGYIFSVLALSLIAFVIAPSALALLRQRSDEPITKDSMRQARIASIATLCVASLLDLFFGNIFGSINQEVTSAFTSYALLTLQSIVSALPYIVLFIALSLLSMNEATVSEFFSNSSEEITE